MADSRTGGTNQTSVWRHARSISDVEHHVEGLLGVRNEFRRGNGVRIKHREWHLRQLPSEDKEKIRIAEEKIREELKDKTIETNQENSQSENQAIKR